MESQGNWRPRVLMIDGGLVGENDLVEKIGGDYDFVGVIRSIFPKLSGLERIVVDDSRGILHIFSGKQLRKIP